MSIEFLTRLLYDRENVVLLYFANLISDDTHISHKKGRMRRTLLHDPVDRLPTQINYTQALGQKMAQYYGIDEQDLPEYFGNHLLRIDIRVE